MTTGAVHEAQQGTTLRIDVVRRADGTMVAPEFVLKTMPPRVPRGALERAPLQRAGDAALERTAIAVVAPAGFGKTTLLAQWRRRRMAQGALVAWLRADAQDEPARFTLGLLHALHAVGKRGAFESLLVQFANDSTRDIDTLTELLAEIASLGHATVLMLDDVERLPESTVQGPLRYLLHNAPPNLHVVIGSRMRLPTDAWELSAKAELSTLGIEDLRLTLEESTQLLRKRFGQRLALDDLARLHEATSGWPLGLQLVSATIERAPDPAAAIECLSGRHGDIERFFFDALVARLAPTMADFLVRTAILEHLNADLCEAVVGERDARDLLERLQAETPIVGAAGVEGWVRLHPLARDFLLGRFEALPIEERHALHARASHWFAERQRFHEAALHALASGDEPLTLDFARRALWSLTDQGKLLEAREWVDRIPRASIADDLDLRIVASWVLSIGERNDEALATSYPLLDCAGLTPMQAFAATRAAFTAAVYGDRPGLLPGILQTWASRFDSPSAPIHHPSEAVAHANSRAMVALHADDGAQVRRILAQVPRLETRGLTLPLAHRLLLIAFSHLYEGDVCRAITAMAPALHAYERSAGRRSLVASAFATVLAAAVFERDRVGEAESLLAHRMDVVDRLVPPDGILVAYRTLARIALARGDERRALLVLDALASLADARGYPRLAMHALAERIRVHALQSRRGVVDGLLRELDRMADVFAQPDWRPFQPRHALQCAIAHAYAAIARDDMDAAAAHLDAAAASRDPARPHRDALTVDVLRAVVARRRREPDALDRLAEARSLGRIGGCERLLAETHPLAVQLGAELEAKVGGTDTTAPATASATRRAERRPALRGGLLTSKEAEILALLDRGMSNKSIARAMEISHETVKWHVKNLSLKLSAGTRQHAVDRARMLGLLAP